MRPGVASLFFIWAVPNILNFVANMLPLHLWKDISNTIGLRLGLEYLSL